MPDVSPPLLEKVSVLNQSQSQAQDSDHSHPICRLRNGMTACPSPVYTVYPVERDGTAPDTHTLLQYTSPEDRAFQERFRSQQEIEFKIANNLGVETHSAIDPPQDNNRDKSDSPAQSSQESQSDTSRPSLRKTLTLVWYCCRRCALTGRFLSFYDRCIGCETPRCDKCDVECVSTKDEEVSISARQRR